MKPNVTPFTAFYSEWLESFRSMLPGWPPSGPADPLTPKQEQIVANQEWEDEGGSIKPVPTTEAKDAPKIPF